MNRKPVEVKIRRKAVSKKLNSVCLCCGKKLEADSMTGTNAEEYPIIYGGVVFRSSGQFGSTVLDCGVGIPPEWEAEIQIIICDECLVNKADIVNTRKNKRGVIERRSHGDYPVQWSDYGTFAELRKAEDEACKPEKEKDAG